jgi:hypothetical protein
MIHRGERLGIKGNGSKEDLDLIERAVSNCQSSHHAPVRLVIGEPDEEDLAGAAEEKFTLLVLPAGEYRFDRPISNFTKAVRRPTGEAPKT